MSVLTDKAGKWSPIPVKCAQPRLTGVKISGHHRWLLLSPSFIFNVFKNFTVGLDKTSFSFPSYLIAHSQNLQPCVEKLHTVTWNQMCNVYRRSKIGILCNINRRRRCLFVFWHFSCSCGKRFTLDFKGAKAFCDIYRRSSCLFLMALFLLLRKTLPLFIIHWLHVTVHRLRTQNAWTNQDVQQWSGEHWGNVPKFKGAKSAAFTR